MPRKAIISKKVRDAMAADPKPVMQSGSSVIFRLVASEGDLCMVRAARDILKEATMFDAGGNAVEGDPEPGVRYFVKGKHDDANAALLTLYGKILSSGAFERGSARGSASGGAGAGAGAGAGPGPLQDYPSGGESEYTEYFEPAASGAGAGVGDYPSGGESEYTEYFEPAASGAGVGDYPSGGERTEHLQLDARGTGVADVADDETEYFSVAEADGVGDFEAAGSDSEGTEYFDASDISGGDFAPAGVLADRAAPDEPVASFYSVIEV